MCGIVGRYNFLSGTPVNSTFLREMCNLLAHRGPDGEGIYHKGHIGLGHRRLAVIDLTEAAHQPMVSEDGRLVITYNGEIYNFRELRTSLEARNHRFRSQSDTEVVLAAYREYGVKCLSFLRGMFAFAIWDSQNKTLFLARDRLGKKPLFYWLDQDGIVFASEPKAFLADSQFTPEVDVTGISHFLTYQYVPTPLSCFRGVHKLPPAHYLIVENGKVRTERYWTLSYANTFQGSEHDAGQELLARLKDAVKARLVSDVPLGAFLSGGIDSSVVVALMADLGISQLDTFSIGFEQQAYNELPHARSVAQHCGTNHHEFMVTPEATKILPKIVWHYNEPFGDSSTIPTFYLAEVTRKHVTVALNGDGGDEALAGYDRYWANVLGGWYDRLPRMIRQSMQRVAGSLPEPRHSKTVLSRAKRFLSVLSENPERRYAHWMCQLSPSLKKEVCTEEFLKEIGGLDSFSLLEEAYRHSDGPDFVDATLDVDVRTYLPDDLLVKVDIATMAHGLEARSPFLDHHVMEFCASLPSQMKLRGWVKKYVLKRAVKDFLPREILQRPKMGFGVPIDHWFQHELREMAYDLLLSPRTIQRGYFKEKMVRRLLDEHVNKIHLWHYQLWNLLMLELWHRMFIDGEWVSAVKVD